MECLVLKRKKDKSPKLIVLSKTKHISEDDVEVHAKWEVLKEWYQAIDGSDDWVDQAIMSIINSIVYQERVYFCLERENIRNLLKNDLNWSKSLGMSNEKYSYLLAELINRGFIGLFDDTKKPHIYKVIEPMLLNMIKIESEEEQLTQVLEFRDKNPRFNTDGKSDGKSDGEKKKIRKEEKESSSVDVEENNLDKNKSVNFEQLLVIQHPESFPNFDEVKLLAQLAVENCPDFDVGKSDLRKLEKHLKSMCKKPSPKQKSFIEKLVSAFEFEAQKYYILRQAEGVRLKEPKKVKADSMKKQVEMEDVIHNNTLNVLKNMFGKEKIKVLKSKLENTQKDSEKKAIEMEIEYLEGIL